MLLTECCWKNTYQCIIKYSVVYRRGNITDSLTVELSWSRSLNVSWSSVQYVASCPLEVVPPTLVCHFIFNCNRDHSEIIIFTSALSWLNDTSKDSLCLTSYQRTVTCYIQSDYFQMQHLGFLNSNRHVCISAQALHQNKPTNLRVKVLQHSHNEVSSTWM